MRSIAATDDTDDELLDTVRSIAAAMEEEEDDTEIDVSVAVGMQAERSAVTAMAESVLFMMRRRKKEKGR